MTDYYIDYTSGSDTDTGTSELRPWKTFAPINALAATITAGDRIMLKRGSSWPSPQQLVLNGANVGSTTVPYIVRPYGAGPAPIIDHNGSTFGYPLSGTGGAVWIDGIEIARTAGADGFGIYWEIPDMSAQPAQWFTNLSVHHCGNDGLYIVASSKTGNTNTRVITGCEVHTCGNDGISIGGGWTGYHIGNNLVHDIAQLAHSTTYGFLDNVIGTSGDGITVHAAGTYCTIRGNTIYNCVDGINNVNYGTDGTTLIDRNYIFACEEKLIWLVNDPSANSTLATPWVIRNNVLCLSSSMANNGVSKGVAYTSTLHGLLIGWPDGEFTNTETEVVFNALVYNNTFSNKHATAPSLTAYAKSAGTNYSTLNIRNNAFSHPGAAPYVNIYGTDKMGLSGANFTCNYNAYTANATAGWGKGVAGTLTKYNTIADWRGAALTPDVNGNVGLTIVDDPAAGVDNGRLASGSTGIGLATNLYGTFQDDYEGRLRPSAGAWDAGAFHRYVGGSAPTITGQRNLKGYGR